MPLPLVCGLPLQAFRLRLTLVYIATAQAAVLAQATHMNDSSGLAINLNAAQDSETSAAPTRASSAPAVVLAMTASDADS